MALRSLAKGTWGPAACALRCRSGAGMPAAAPSRFLASVRNQVKKHNNGTRKETSDEKALIMKELDKVFEALSATRIWKNFKARSRGLSRFLPFHLLAYLRTHCFGDGRTESLHNLLYRALPMNNLYCP
ncbi:uncharacterized protein LOC120702389 isoform X1 [Panicum virgatum]|uniref:uncharacterized protein LOC120702389 isoform X1 n=1 Tax=Panicum virgatum TaxID=38727 RepID=UPI0019D544B7|nr:uncharacterized protein LOC120702389 isoform X1 [Panicum virgatum]